MKPSHLMAAVAALLVVASFDEPSGAAVTCPSFTIKAEADSASFGGDDTLSPALRFSVTPTPAGATYNWSVSNGMIIRGQGTEAIVVFGKGIEGQSVTASLQVLGLDKSCAKQATLSATAQMEAE